MGSNHRPLSYQDSVLPLNYTLKHTFSKVHIIIKTGLWYITNNYTLKHTFSKVHIIIKTGLWYITNNYTLKHTFSKVHIRNDYNKNIYFNQTKNRPRERFFVHYYF